jgi:hypothetical protein
VRPLATALRIFALACATSVVLADVAGGSAGGGARPVGTESRTLASGGRAGYCSTLAWKHTGWRALVFRGSINRELLAGNVLYMAGVSVIGGKHRHLVSAVDVRTGTVLPFAPNVPLEGVVVGMAVSPTTFYIAFSFVGPDQSQNDVLAYDRRTGARVTTFKVTDFQDGWLRGIEYARGSVILVGYPQTGPGLAAYDPVTGARRWGVTNQYPNTSMVTDGSRLYVGIGGGNGVPPAQAYDAATGDVVTTWGASLSRTALTSFTFGGVDARIVVGSSLAPTGPLVLSTSTGAYVKLPHLPSKTVSILSTTGRAILARVGNNFISHPVVLNSTGRIIGSDCKGWPVALRDSRHLLVGHVRSTTTSSLLMVGPRKHHKHHHG